MPDKTNKPWETEVIPEPWVYSAESGYWCSIVRIEEPNRGHLCGYVTIPAKSILAEWCRRIPSGYDHVCNAVRVHGGLSYYKPATKDRRIKIGFDCAHAGDVCPYDKDPILHPGYAYKGVEYVKEELSSLCSQLTALEPVLLYTLIDNHLRLLDIVGAFDNLEVILRG